MLHFTDMSILFLVLTKIGITLQSVVFLSPLALFLIVYGDVTIQFIVWCGCIKDDAILNQKDSTSNMKNLRQFLKALRDISEIFSYFIFWILVLSLIGLLLATYRSIAFILGSYLITWESVFMSMSYFIYFQAYVVMIWYLCHVSQTLAAKIQELKIVLLNLSIKKAKKMVTKEDITEIDLVDQDKSIHLQLQEFRGYNAEDFFVVNHSLITGMISNYVTYTILLIRFKLMEMSMK